MLTSRLISCQKHQSHDSLTDENSVIASDQVHDRIDDLITGHAFLSLRDSFGFGPADRPKGSQNVDQDPRRFGFDADIIRLCPESDDRVQQA